MKRPVEEIAFLASSENRVHVLEALTDGPHARHEIEAIVNISRMTAKRILDDFETRSWVFDDGHGYRASPLGAAISTVFSELCETVAMMQRLSPVLEWFPAKFDVDLRHLQDVQITVPDASDPLAPVRRSAELMNSAKTVQGLAAGIAPDVLRVNRDGVVNHGQSFEVVLSTDVLNLIRTDAQMNDLLEEILHAGGRAYVSEEVSYLLAEFDQRTVVLGLRDEAGVPRATVEIEGEQIREWFHSTFETYRNAAEEITPEVLTPSSEDVPRDGEK